MGGARGAVAAAPPDAKGSRGSTTCRLLSTPKLLAPVPSRLPRASLAPSYLSLASLRASPPLAPIAILPVSPKPAPLPPPFARSPASSGDASRRCASSRRRGSTRRHECAARSRAILSASTLTTAHRRNPRQSTPTQDGSLALAAHTPQRCHETVAPLPTPSAAVSPFNRFYLLCRSTRRLIARVSRSHRTSWQTGLRRAPHSSRTTTACANSKPPSRPPRSRCGSPSPSRPLSSGQRCARSSGCETRLTPRRKRSNGRSTRRMWSARSGRCCLVAPPKPPTWLLAVLALTFPSGPDRPRLSFPPLSPS